MAQFDGNPGSAVDFVDERSTYFDIYAGPSNSFEQVTIVTCDLPSGDKLYWWDAATLDWRLASGQSYAGGCITAVVTGDSSPSLANLQGIYFAAGAEALPTVQLTSSLNPSVFGQSLALTAQVSGGYGMPTGSVTFRDGGLVLSGCEEVVLQSGNASCEVSAFAAGTHLLEVEYSGNEVYLSGSATLEQEVSKADAILTLSDLDYVYDGTPKAASVTTEPEDGILVTVTYNGDEAPPTDAGSYAVVATINDPNYQGVPVDGTLVITRRPVTVTAFNQTKIYGEGDPDLTHVVTSGSLVEGDVFTGALARDEGEAVGEYPIQQGTLSAGGNYDLTFEEGRLTITKAFLTVKADDKTRQYSDPNPAFTYTISGFVRDDGEDVVSGEPVLSTSAAWDSPAGDYPIYVELGTLNAQNYAFAFVSGELTIDWEDAALTYTGDTQVTTSKAGAKVTVTLAATLEEDQDGWLGIHLSEQVVLFQVKNFGESVVASCTATIGNVSNGKGYGSCTVSLGASDPYQVHISLLENTFYTAPEEDIVLSVNDPGTGMTAGGGWLVDPNTSSRVNFGFTAKFLKNGKVQGNSLFIYRVTTDLSQLVPGAPEGLREYNWMIKSNAMQGLNVYDCPVDAQIGCKATITGKNNLQAVDRLTGVTYSLGGNYQFQVDVYDNREPNSPPDNPDQYAIRVWNASGMYYMLGDAYDENGMLIAPLEISGGNILVKDKK